MKVKSFAELFEKARERETFLSASIILEFTEGLYDLMQANNISRKELAKRLGTSPAYITKVLRGDINFTIDSMVKLAKAAGGTVQVHIGREQVQWLGKVKKKKEPIPGWSEYTQPQIITYSQKDEEDGPIPLRLRQYFFTKIYCEADPNYKSPQQDAGTQHEVKVQSNVAPRKDNDRDWRVILDIHVSSLEKPAPYQLDLQVTGFFEVLPDFPDDKVKELIRITGASILYSGAREFVLGITSRGPWAPVMLPAISFMKPDQQEEPKAKKIRKVKSASPA